MIPHHQWNAGNRNGVRHAARGLCQRCWVRASRNGTLTDAATVRRSLADTVAEYQIVAAGGAATLAEIAAQMGITRGALDTALVRARKRGLLPPATRRKALPTPLDDETVARLRRMAGAA